MKMFVSAIVAIVVAGPVLADELKPWGTEGEWEILVDPEVDNGCLMQKSFGDTLIQIGYNPSREGGFFAAYNADWTDIEEGVASNIRFDFPKAKFGGEVVGDIRDGMPGGYAFFDNPEFVTEFTKRMSVTVTGERGRSMDIDLTGTTRGVNAVKACQDAQPK